MPRDTPDIDRPASPMPVRPAAANPTTRMVGSGIQRAATSISTGRVGRFNSAEQDASGLGDAVTAVAQGSATGAGENVDMPA